MNNIKLKERKVYAIIDVETTGLAAKSEKITEIAILIHDGEKITKEFASLINPQRKIPYRITQLTGINNQMVAGAPKFYEIAKEIIELTENKIIVGHNVTFDYNFIRAEFEEFGYDFKRKTLCTCKLSRKLIPFQKSYSLGNLCSTLQIENPNQHRAAGDAKATSRLFELLMQIDPELDKVSYKGLNANLCKDTLDRLPYKPGVYYFHNSNGDIIYVGKSINIHDRVLSHLSNNSTKKAIAMRNNIADVSYELTGNELIALLLESNEIKKLKPIYNSSQRRSLFNYGLFSYYDEKGYLCLKIEKNNLDLFPITSWHTLNEAKESLHDFVKENQLCQKLSGLYQTRGACFHYHIKECKGACIGEESPENYNENIEKALKRYEFDFQNFYIIHTGRKTDERSVVKVVNGKYIGFGFGEPSLIGNNLEVLDDCIKPFPDNKDIQTIIRGYLRRNKVEKIIPFED